ELRLVGGGGRCAGRVEVKHDGEWGSVCVQDFNWDARWATVVCRQLGCGSVARASVYAPFGEATGRVWLQPFFCLGDEEVLEDCSHLGWGQHFCSHKRDVGVTCTDALELRLVAGGHPCAGRVEVKLQGRWGTVGDNVWDMEDAEVVCQQLGCGSAAGAYAATSYFGKGDGPISLALVDCRGHEATLWDCEIRGWGPYATIHDFDTAVVCQGRSQAAVGKRRSWHTLLIADPAPLTLPVGFARLVGGPGACAGRLEVRRGRAWVGVCQDDVDIEAARVVCRELGCGEALAGPVAGPVEEGTGPLWQGGFNCTGTEPLLASSRVLPCPRGSGGHFAGVAEPLRLVEGQSRCHGRLEVATSPGAWASVAAGLWDARAAAVVCRQLGCGVPEKVYAVPGSGTKGLPGLRCDGTEENLAQCNVSVSATTLTGSPKGVATFLPGSPEEVAIVCSGDRQVRLAGGPGRCSGRVEVYIEGTWATVCQENWDLADATVVCRQLGCGTAVVAPSSDPYAPGMGPPWPDAGGCAGSEASLWDCPSLAQHGCQRGGGASAICSEHRSLRLVGGSSRCSGHLEVFYNGTWGRVCAKGTSSATATAVCEQLDCGVRGWLAAAPSSSPSLAWLAWVGCQEGTRSLWQCPSAPW
ncbi:C163A protein, partial [Pedionomus torquatus]|nr:C163A protein [Pedionomus torquatus]